MGKLKNNEASLMMQLQTMHNECDKLRKNESLSQDEIKSLQFKNEKLQKNESTLLGKLEASKKDYETLQSDNYKLKNMKSLLLQKLSVAHNECKELKQQLNKLRIQNIDTTKYLEWTGDDFVDWICSLDDERFKQYEEKLKSVFAEEGISGNAIPYIQKEEWKGFGIKNYMDRTRIQAHVDKLTNAKAQHQENDNDDDEGKMTEYH